MEGGSKREKEGVNHLCFSILTLNFRICSRSSGGIIFSWSSWVYNFVEGGMKRKKGEGRGHLLMGALGFTTVFKGG